MQIMPTVNQIENVLSNISINTIDNTMIFQSSSDCLTVIQLLQEYCIVKQTMPDKFINLTALVKSYRELESKFHKASMEKAKALKQMEATLTIARYVQQSIGKA